MADNGHAAYGRGSGAILTESMCFRPSEPATIKSSGSLPHWHQDRVLQFITFRLADSLPRTKLQQLKRQKESWESEHPKPWDVSTATEFHRTFGDSIDRWLDAGYGACELSDQTCRQVVVDALLFFDRQRYYLYDYVVMPNHVHIIVFPIDSDLPGIIHSLKSFTANKINRFLNRSGALWERDYFDRIIRSVNDYDRIALYIRENYLQASHFTPKPQVPSKHP